MQEKQRFSAVSYFRKTLHLKCLKAVWICLCWPSKNYYPIVSKCLWNRIFCLLELAFLVKPEAAARGVLWKKVFLEISQNRQENTCARVSFLIKLQALGRLRQALAQAFSCEFCEISKNTFLQSTFGGLLLWSYCKVDFNFKDLLLHQIFNSDWWNPQDLCDSNIPQYSWSFLISS